MRFSRSAAAETLVSNDGHQHLGCSVVGRVGGRRKVRVDLITIKSDIGCAAAGSQLVADKGAIAIDDFTVSLDLAAVTHAREHVPMHAALVEPTALRVALAER